MPAFVQGALGADLGNSPSTTTSVTLSAPVTTGNAVLGSFVYGAPGAVMVTDDKGNVYTVFGGAAGLFVFYALNLTNAPSIITVNGTITGDYLRIVADEFSGLGALDNYLIVSYSGASGTDAITTGNVTTHYNGDLIYGSLAEYFTDETTAVGTNFTATEMSNWGSDHQGAGGEYLIQASAGPIAVTFSPSSSVQGQVAMMAFKPALLAPMTLNLW